MSAPFVDPRRPDKVTRYKAPQNTGQGTSGGDDFMPDYMNILGMIFSMCGLMMKLKWCGRYLLGFVILVSPFDLSVHSHVSIHV